MNFLIIGFGLISEKRKRNEKPIRQNWGWSTIVDVWNPRHDWKDEETKSEMIGTWTIG